MARKEKLAKTNAMRELETAGIAYELRTYAEEDVGDDYGLRVAQLTGADPDACFKTLVCVAPGGGHVVCCIPVACELDLKKAAAAAGEKTLAMMHVRDLEPTTGYVRGGCSPVGMKKLFPTLFDETMQLYERVAVSGGKRGYQLLVDPEALAAHLGAAFASLTREG